MHNVQHPLKDVFKLDGRILLNRTAKMQKYKTLIRPVVTYGSETLTLTEADKERLRRFERKVVRKIYGGVRMGRTNGESDTTVKSTKSCKTKTLFVSSNLVESMVWTYSTHMARKVVTPRGEDRGQK